MSIHDEDPDHDTYAESPQVAAKTPHKFYVGAEHIGISFARGNNAPVVRATIAEAIEDARKKLHDNPRCDAVVIVEIIRIVRRREPQLVIEEV